MKRRIIATIVTMLALAVPAVASADQTVSIPGFNCSVTAYTPTFSGGANVIGQTGVSCGGSQVNYSKQADTQLMNLVTGGWQQVSSTGWSAWSTGNPLTQGIGGGCVPGRWYAVNSEAQVMHNGTVSGASASSEGSGAQCPSRASGAVSRSRRGCAPTLGSAARRIASRPTTGRGAVRPSTEI